MKSQIKIVCGPSSRCLTGNTEKKLDLCYTILTFGRLFSTFSIRILFVPLLVEKKNILNPKAQVPLTEERNFLNRYVHEALNFKTIQYNCALDHNLL